MKNKIYTVGVLLLFALVTSSCEKVIDVDLKNAEPRLIIEGHIMPGTGSYVKISKTVPFSAPHVYPKVSGAVVILTNDLGESETLQESSFAGTYMGHEIMGRESRVYTLTVRVEGQEYVARSTMPKFVKLDEVKVDRIKFPLGADEKIVFIPGFQDPIGERNTYKFNIFVNGEKDPAILPLQDKNMDGQYNKLTVWPSYDIKKGDKVTFEMQCVDEGAYYYYATLSENEQSASPANPVSNFSGGCLGVFSAHTSEEVDLVIE